MNNPPKILIDPTDTEHSDLVIEPEDLTQWVDGELTSYHNQSIDLLSEKFPILESYKSDIQEIQSSLKETYQQNIPAPADTLLRVLKSIKEEEAENTPIEEPTPEEESPEALQATPPSESEQTEETPTLPLSENTEPEPIEPAQPPEKPFTITLNIKPTKKHSPFLYPVAAILVLGCSITAFSILAHKREHSLALKQEEPSKELRSPSSRILQRMESDAQDPHAPQKQLNSIFTLGDTADHHHDDEVNEPKVEKTEQTQEQAPKTEETESPQPQ